MRKTGDSDTRKAEQAIRADARSHFQGLISQGMTSPEYIDDRFAERYDPVLWQQVREQELRHGKTGYNDHEYYWRGQE